MKLSLIAVILIIVLTFSSCSSNNIVINIDVSCEEFELKSSHLGNEFDIKKGDAIKASICANPSTGFTWDYTIDDETIVKLDKHEFMKPETDLVGAPGVDVWTFKALAPGKTVIKLEYGQDLDGGTKAERSYTLQITVMEPTQ